MSVAPAGAEFREGNHLGFCPWPCEPRPVPQRSALNSSIFIGTAARDGGALDAAQADGKAEH